MRITKIERQKNNASRRSVFMDGEYAFGVSLDSLVRLSLYEGRELSKTESELLQQSARDDDAKRSAMHYLSRRPRTEKEITDYLAKKKFDEQTTRRALAALNDLHLLDDSEFTRMFCRDKIQRKPVGERILRSALLRKGVSKEIINTVMPEFFSHDAERELALHAGKKQYTKLLRSRSHLEKMQLKNRLFNFLLRRGFGFDTAQYVLRQLLADKESQRDLR
ncbi:MAG: RecX family transcriptional regulator [Bacteroidota bacterium]|nr:RecX family transcriptional regulator [Bacteroidota bacterium]